MIKRILLSLPLWLAYTAVEVALHIVGLVILLPLSLAHAWHWRSSKVYKAPRADGKSNVVAAWKGGWLTWIWGNEEDGVTGPNWWVRDHFLWPLWRWAYVWSALRNPTNNMRFIPGINPVINPSRIKYAKRLGWNKAGVATETTLTWQGPFAGLLILFQLRGAQWRFWWGWKLKPEDRDGVSDADMRKPRCGFAIQLKRVS